MNKTLPTRLPKMIQNPRYLFVVDFFCIFFFSPRYFSISVEPEQLQFPGCIYIAEPFFFTLALYDKEDRAKISEDFHFTYLPTDKPEKFFSVGGVRKAIFNLDTETSKTVFMVMKCYHIHSANESPYKNYASKGHIIYDPQKIEELISKTGERIMRHEELKQPFGIWMYPIFKRFLDG
jgi:hypothetical protein